MGYAVINFDNDRRDDIIYAYGTQRDQWGVGYAEELRISLQGSDYEGPRGPRSGLRPARHRRLVHGPDLQLHPIDHDGNGLTDLWLCRGDGYKTSHWVLALNEGDNSTFQYSFHDTNVGCSIHDELNVVSLRGQTQNLLVVPAYEWDPALMQYPGMTNDYVEDVPPRAESLRTTYLELQFDPGSGQDGDLVPTGLPRDLFQRWRDRECHNSVAGAEVGMPVFSAGMGLDRQVDLNGDGYVDILRAELATDPVGFPGEADTHNNLPAIMNNLGPDDSWALGVTCDDYLPLIDHEDVVLRAWINTGDGFERGDVMHTFSGNPHANLWLNIVGGQLFDANRDGLADLLVPSTGLGESWTVLYGSGKATDCPGGSCFIDLPIGLGSGWPAYTSDNAWKEDVERGGVVQMRGMGGILFEGFVDASPDPTFEVAQLYFDFDHPLGYLDDPTNSNRLHRVTDGLGAEEEFEYGCAGDELSLATLTSLPTAANRPKAPPRTCIPVVWEHTVQTPPVYTSGLNVPENLTTRYAYGGAVIDQHGRGFVGFEQVQQSTAITSVFETDVTTLAEFDLGYDATLRDYPRARIPERVRATRRFTDLNGNDRLHVQCTDVEGLESYTTEVVPRLGGNTWFTYANQVRTLQRGCRRSRLALRVPQLRRPRSRAGECPGGAARQRGDRDAERLDHDRRRNRHGHALAVRHRPQRVVHRHAAARRGRELHRRRVRDPDDGVPVQPAGSQGDAHHPRARCRRRPDVLADGLRVPRRLGARRVGRADRCVRGGAEHVHRVGRRRPASAVGHERRRAYTLPGPRRGVGGSVGERCGRRTNVGHQIRRVLPPGDDEAPQLTAGSR